MLKMALEIQKNSVYSVVAISNAKYNELYAKFKNLNKLLAWGHAKVIENILEKQPCEYALSDKFGDESLIKNALQKHGQNITLEQRTKAESDIAVAALLCWRAQPSSKKCELWRIFTDVNSPKAATT